MPSAPARELWLLPANKPARGSLVCYDFATGERVWSRPNVGNGYLYWCQHGLIMTRANNREMHSFSLKDGSHLWEVTMGTKLFGLPACFYQGDTIWGYGKGSWYYAYDPATGKCLRGDSGRWKEFGRCNPDRATGRYILGPEFEILDVAGGQMWNFGCLRRLHDRLDPGQRPGVQRLHAGSAAAARTASAAPLRFPAGRSGRRR